MIPRAVTPVSWRRNGGFAEDGIEAADKAILANRYLLFELMSRATIFPTRRYRVWSADSRVPMISLR